MQRACRQAKNGTMHISIMTAHIIRLMLLAFTCRLYPHPYPDPYNDLVLLLLRILCTHMFAFILTYFVLPIVYPYAYVYIVKHIQYLSSTHTCSRTINAQSKQQRMRQEQCDMVFRGQFGNCVRFIFRTLWLQSVEIVPIPACGP